MIADPSTYPEDRPEEQIAAASCANCEAPLEGPFCSACGQRYRLERLSIGSLLGESLQRLFNFDRGFLGTAKELTRAPGSTIRQYLSGRRRQILNPFTYLVFSSALGLIVHRLANLFADQSIEASLFEQEGMPPEAQAFFAEFVTWTFDHSLWITLVMAVPFTLMCYLLFRRQRLHLAETAVLSLFAFGHLQLVSSVAYLPSFFLPTRLWNFRHISQASVVLMIGYLVVVCLSFYGKRFGTFFKALLAAGVAWGSIFVLIAIGMGFYIARHPELMAHTERDSLLTAIEANRRESVEGFLNEGADPNTERRQSALHLALTSGSSEIVQTLLEAGADPESSDSSDRTPLERAVLSRRPDVVELLLAHGADPERRREDDATALMLATERGTRLIRPLLAAGAKVNARRDAPLATALMIAADLGNAKRVEALLAAGADPTITNPEGENALDVAHSRVRDTLAAAMPQVEKSNS